MLQERAVSVGRRRRRGRRIVVYFVGVVEEEEDKDGGKKWTLEIFDDGSRREGPRPRLRREGVGRHGRRSVGVILFLTRQGKRSQKKEIFARSQRLGRFNRPFSLPPSSYSRAMRRPRHFSSHDMPSIP